MNKKVPNKAQILKTLKLHKADLEKYGVKRVGLFGSFVSGSQKAKSDIDLIVEFDRDNFGKDFRGLFDSYIELTDYLEKILGRKVDIITPAGLESIRIKEIAEEIKRSAAYV
jgi:uncharacterized protein